MTMMLRRLTLACAFVGTLSAVQAADFPKPKEADWVAKAFTFHTGETLPELSIHYTTVGEPTGEPVLILHGTAGSGTGMLNPAFGGELFGPGQPLDASKYYIILPDAIGTGKTTRPSSGLKAKFPQYNYADMVQAQYRLVTEGLGVKHLRLVLGNSMGGMHTWLWGTTYPGFADVLVPMASQPTAMSSRNWMMRRLIVDSIRNDPDWNNGNYTSQPKSAKFASIFYNLGTNGGTLNYQNVAPTSAKADAYLDAQLNGPFTADANDLLYQWASSRDFDASPKLEAITSTVLAINAADDERNPPETGIMVREMKRLKAGEMLLIPASVDTRGHGTTAMAKFWKDKLAEMLARTPKGM
jgi:homoserine O-acetyltransferase